MEQDAEDAKEQKTEKRGGQKTQRRSGLWQRHTKVEKRLAWMIMTQVGISWQASCHIPKAPYPKCRKDIVAELRVHIDCTSPTYTIDARRAFVCVITPLPGRKVPWHGSPPMPLTDVSDKNGSGDDRDMLARGFISHEANVSLGAMCHNPRRGQRPIRKRALACTTGDGGNTIPLA